MLNDNQLNLIWLLTQKVRVLSERQVERRYFGDQPHNPRKARRLLQALQAHGLVTLRQTMLHPEIPLLAPVFAYRPGGQPPHAGKVSWALRTRWNQPPRRTCVAWATERARRTYGGLVGRCQVRSTELLHDVHLTALYLRLETNLPSTAQAWMHEDTLDQEALADFGGKIPDAMVGQTAIDFGGSYSPSKIKLIHEAFCNRHYEIW